MFAGIERSRWLAALVLLAALLLAGFLTVPTAEAAAPVEISAVAESDASEGRFSAPDLKREDYPRSRYSSRSVVWVLAQMHLFFAAFVLAVPLFVVFIEWLGVRSGDSRYDDMAHEFMKISMTAYSITALFGGALALALFMLYPQFMQYMARVFDGQFLIYALLFFAETVLLYLYFYSWYALRYGNLKWVHLCLGVALNVAGTTILVMANAWSTFMMAPSGVDVSGALTSGNIWEVIRGPLWNPMNLHRFIANIAFGGAIVGAYAAYKFLAARTLAERAHYDWMGYTSNFIAILAFLPLPFAGYWLMAEIYAYSQQMGITAMGGILAWLFIVQAVLIGTILLAANYYLWSGMSRTGGAGRYGWMIKYIAVVLVLSFLVWVTPHSLILTPAESAQMGGSAHRWLGPLGLMPAKNVAVNLMLVATFLSFQLYRRSGKQPTVAYAGVLNTVMVAIYFWAVVTIIFSGVYYGYFTNTVYKVGSSVVQVVATLSVIVGGVVIDSLLFRRARVVEAAWGQVSTRSQYALFALPVAFTWLMALMGYIRSSVRGNWHVYTVMKDNSADNFIPAIGHAGNMMTLVTLLFLACILFIFFIASLSEKRQLPPVAGEA
ncbi:cytochrome ubiquinol oxidase subunit I [Aestuariirhabdus sp. LZHN29]|uniref:cytochrome ubiquinol oxidase subunit I n=1 Tax=Aestuariirhabdus sp. LZHN29 TaxID=3417462 RepID=UPI003CFAFA8A